jgi:hypothetical protein
MAMTAGMTMASEMVVAALETRMLWLEYVCRRALPERSEVVHG